MKEKNFTLLLFQNLIFFFRLSGVGEWRSGPSVRRVLVCVRGHGDCLVSQPHHQRHGAGGEAEHRDGRPGPPPQPRLSGLQVPGGPQPVVVS